MVFKIKERITNLMLRIFKNKQKNDQKEKDYFHLTKRFFSYLGLWYSQSDLRRRIGLFVFIVTLLSGNIPQVITLIYRYIIKLFEYFQPAI